MTQKYVFSSPGMEFDASIECHFPGALEYTGNVGSAAHIEAKGAVTIDGNIGEDAKIVAFGPVTIHGNIGKGARIIAYGPMQIKGRVGEGALLACTDAMQLHGRIDKQVQRICQHYQHREGFDLYPQPMDNSQIPVVRLAEGGHSDTGLDGFETALQQAVARQDQYRADKAARHQEQGEEKKLQAERIGAAIATMGRGFM